MEDRIDQRVERKRFRKRQQMAHPDQQRIHAVDHKLTDDEHMPVPCKDCEHQAGAVNTHKCDPDSRIRHFAVQMLGKEGAVLRVKCRRIIGRKRGAFQQQLRHEQAEEKAEVFGKQCAHNIDQRHDHRQKERALSALHIGLQTLDDRRGLFVILLLRHKFPLAL